MYKKVILIFQSDSCRFYFDKINYTTIIIVDYKEKDKVNKLGQILKPRLVNSRHLQTVLVSPV